MAYTKHTWDCGEVIDDNKLNNIEDGIEEALNASGGLMLTSTGQDLLNCDIFNYTWKEVYDAVMMGKSVYMTHPNTSRISSLVELNTADHIAYFGLVDEENGYVVPCELTALPTTDDNAYFKYCRTQTPQ